VLTLPGNEEKAVDFFGMGFGEVLLILVLVIIIWGPGKIVSVSRTMGKIAHDLKKATSDFTTQIIRETEESEKKTPPATAQPPTVTEQEPK
jgi:sec-independent protein translocase protein TatA